MFRFRVAAGAVAVVCVGLAVGLVALCLAFPPAWLLAVPAAFGLGETVASSAYVAITGDFEES